MRFQPVENGQRFSLPANERLGFVAPLEQFVMRPSPEAERAFSKDRPASLRTIREMIVVDRSAAVSFSGWAGLVQFMR